jgi:ribonuclease T1
MGRRTSLALGLVAIVLVVLGCALPSSNAASAAGGPPFDEPPAGSGAPAGMSVVALVDLPPEAATTVALIIAGGPFPYRQDGAVFENREGLLPDEPSGFYREYTVPTPGEDDRGARRIVAGADGSLYWTADHYDSFAWIDR